MISLDCETTGVDFNHIARPFFVTICKEDGEILNWEWEVDPETRYVKWKQSDIEEILAETGFDQDDRVVMQNGKFDIIALSSLDEKFGELWRWDLTEDTLIAGHLLASNKPHNLTDMAIQYLGKVGAAIEPLEEALKKCVKECRTLCRSKLPTWRICNEGDPEIPSAKEKTWAYDYWLPKAVAKHYKYPSTHPYWTVLEEYANGDSATTLMLWKVMWQEIQRRDLVALYRESMKLPPIFKAMQERGVTVSGTRLTFLRKEYTEGSNQSKEVCEGIATSYGYELELPKGRSNKLQEFMFDVMKLPVHYHTETGKPSMAKEAMEDYTITLPTNSKELLFVKKLMEKRVRDTALSFLDSYEKFWVPYGREQDSEVMGHWYVLHPSLNQTGTSTLRGSMENPNGQQVSKKEGFNLRYMFGPAPDREWWSADAKGIEDRLPAYKSGQQELIDIFERDKEPPFYGSNHLLRFSIVYPDIWEAAVKEVGLDKAGPYCKKKYASTYYQWCKNGGFAVQYCAVEKRNGWGTADRAFHKQYSHRLLKDRLAKLENYNRKWIDFANKYGYVETMPDNSIDPKRGYPLLCSRTENGRILETIPLNYHIQGCLSGDSRVHTKEGWIPIRELVGKNVSVWTGFKWADAVGLDRGPCQRVNIVLNSGAVIRCDTRHKLKNERDEWVHFENLRVGDMVCLPDHVNPPLPYSGEVNWWFVFGFIIGDGSLISRPGRKSLAITGGKTKKTNLEDIYHFLQGNSPQGDAYNRRGYGTPKWNVKERRDRFQELYVVSMESKPFSEFLESQGFSYDWRFNTKRIPESVWRASPQEQRDFLEGLLLSDGARYSQAGSGRRLNMNNPDLLREIQILSGGLGFDSTYTNGYLNLRWNSKGAKSSRRFPLAPLLKRVKEVRKENYEDQNEYITDKRNFDLALRGNAPTHYVGQRIIQRNAVDKTTYRYDVITDIRLPEVIENTYTMSVDDPFHQFVADGVIHKNTAMWWMRRAMVRCHEKLQEWNQQGFDGHIILQVHDELVFDFPRSKIPPTGDTSKFRTTNSSNLWRARILQKLMERGGEDIGVPTPTSLTYHDTCWSEGVDL